MGSIKHLKKVLGNINVDIMAKNDELFGVSRYQRKTIEKGKNLS